jgi:hypothetical protein
MNGADRIFEFKADTPEIAKNWAETISKHIIESDGFKGDKTCLGLKKPWRFDHMSSSQFCATADTGDILLFRGSQTGSKITRAFTGGYFDHVAMVLKFESDPNEIYFVEATGNMGVSLNSWSKLKEHVGPGKFYKKLIFRHVNFERGDKMVDNLERFLSEAVGQSYGLGGLLKQKTMKPTKDSERLIQEDRSFFCSELVAKAFKLLGVIQDDDTSCT